MIRLALDEDCPDHFAQALRRRIAGVDVRTTKDGALLGAADSTQLDRAAAEERLLITRDRALSAEAQARTAAGQLMCGLIVVSHGLPMAKFLDEMEEILKSSEAIDWVGRVWWLSSS